MSKYAAIKCAKCGYETNEPVSICFKCKGKVEKICGECGFLNSIAKNYCDKCGSPLIKIKNKPKPADRENNSKMPSYASSIQKHARKTPAPQPPKKTKSVISAAAALSLSAVLLFIFYLIAKPYTPRIKLLMTTKKYLTQLSKGNYEAAYKMLSANSKTSCSMEIYVKNTSDYYSQKPKWEFKDVKIFQTEKNAALIKYKLKEGQTPWKDDYISFVKENETWSRPYIWNLFGPIDKTFKNGDYSNALFLAQKLNLIDPMDPRTWGYLCSAQYNLGLYDKSVVSCERTIEISNFYPVGFNDIAVAWYYFQLANSLKYIKKYEPALDIYASLLNNPEAADAEKCQIFINRSDAYAGVENYESALKDILAAKNICSPDFQKDMQTFHRYLLGTAKEEAINFAQKSRFNPDMPAISDIRKKEIRAHVKRLGSKRKRFAPKDIWSATHLDGPNYRVFLREEKINTRTRRRESKDLYTFKVNLWSHTIVLEKEGLK